MNNTLRLEIVTPDAVVYSEDVDMVTLPGTEGQLGILPQHVPLMTYMVPGEMIVLKNGRDRFLAVGEGFVEITCEHVAILTDLAVAAENIDEAKAEDAAQARWRQTPARSCLPRKSLPSTPHNHRSLAQLRLKRTTTASDRGRVPDRPPFIGKASDGAAYQFIESPAVRSSCCRSGWPRRGPPRNPRFLRR